jgi:hypothetical protein
MSYMSSKIEGKEKKRKKRGTLNTSKGIGRKGHYTITCSCVSSCSVVGKGEKKVGRTLYQHWGAHPHKSNRGCET